MRKFSFAGVLFVVAVLSAGLTEARGTVQNRITSAGMSRDASIPNSVSPRLRADATDIGAADGARVLNSVTLRFTMTEAQKASLIQLLEDQQNPASARYHQWLTPEQFAAKYGMSTADMTAVSQWLTGQGFQVTSVARSRTFIQVSGTVEQAQSAFKTNIHRVSVRGEEHIANVSAISLPAGIASVVASVEGLNDFRLKPHSTFRQVPATSDPKYTSSSSGNTFIAPGDFYTIYDVKPLLTSSVNGSGITIAVAGQTDISLADVAAFRSASGLSANNPTVKLYGNDPGTKTDDIGEAQLDVEWSGAVAPSASILYVNSTDVINSLTKIIDNRLAPIASISYGLCEAGTGAADMDALNTLFMQGNAQGMTIVGAAGDSGATDCDYHATTATQGLAVDFPASSPYVTAMGGTSFNEGTGTYFGTSNDANGGSAISYIPEAVWNESAADIAAGYYLGATGGGVSYHFAKPSWQTGTGVPNDFSRDLPDVSLNAAANHDGYLYCSQGSCVNGFRTSSTPTTGCTTGGCLSVVGGTSVATPAFAGILALVQQKIGSATGNANPVIYALANSTYYNTVFHDVTIGNNASPCTAGSTDCPSGGNIGYSATVGYDLTTGWGSVDAFNLANTWKLVTPVSSGPTGTQVSTTTETASAASVTGGASVTITAKVDSSASSSTVPSGTVQFLVDGTASGSAVALSNGGATYSLATAALASGVHVVSAVYSGDAVYAGSKGNVSVDVTSAAAADFTLTPATTTITVKAGADAAGVLYTVTPVNGFTGSVAFKATTTSSTLNATPSFSVTPVVISSAAAGTTTFILSAYVSNAQGSLGELRGNVGMSALREQPAPASRTWYAGSGAAMGVLLLLLPIRRRRPGLLLALLAIGAVTAMTGCGSSTSSAPATSNSVPGTYSVFVTATGTSASGSTTSHTSAVTFVVQ